MINDPAQYDINVYQDRDFSITFIIKDQSGVLVDISDWTLSSQLRPSYNSEILIANFTVTSDDVTSAITVTLDDAITAAITAENLIELGSTTTSTNLVWDLVVDKTGPPAERFTLITGICNFYDTVTRAV